MWFIGIVCVFFMAAGPVVRAEQYPDKPITLLTVFPPGGGSDVSHRTIEKYTKGIFDKPLVIVYKAGAGGELGWTELVGSKPDGYIIGGVDIPHIILQPMVREKGQTGFKTEELLPICGLVIDPDLIIVHKDSKWKNLKEFMDDSRANPGQITAGTVGKFTGDHMFLMRFEFATGLKFTQVPYSGGGKAIPALMGKQVDCYFASANSYLRMEDVRALGVATEQRYELAPDVPTLKEQGVNVISIKRRGLAAPLNTPKDRIKYLENAIKKINDIPEYQVDVKKVGLTPHFMSSDEFGKYIEDETKNARETLTKFGFFATSQIM
jgi:tripartite-type tricarboxylate transporter receptor subunit TctC